MTLTTDQPTEHAAGPRLRHVEVLTDEELSLLTSGPGAVVTPYFSDLAAADIELVQRTAYRSLVARGIVEQGVEPEPGPTRLSVREDVLTLMTLRQAATTLVAVARTLVDAQDFWYAHVVEELVVLEEVSQDGLHRFALGYSADLPVLLADAALHPDAVDGRGETVSIDAMPDEQAPTLLLEVLGQAHVRADVVVVTVDPSGSPRPDQQRPELTGVFSGPQGTWSVTSAPGVGATAAPERVEALRERLRALGSAARDAGATS